MSALANALSSGQIYWPSQSEKTDAAKLCVCTCGLTPVRFRSYANKARFKRAQLAGCCCTCSNVANIYKLPSTCNDLSRGSCMPSLPGPMIDLSNTILNLSTNILTIAWFPVDCATSYKVFHSDRGVQSIFYNTTSSEVTSRDTPVFSNDSGPLSGLSYEVDSQLPQNYYVYSYSNGVRGSLPTTQVFVNQSLQLIVEVWPTITITSTAPVNGFDVPTLGFQIPIVCKNVYTNESVALSVAEQIAMSDLLPQLAVIHANVPLQTKTF